MSLSMKYSGPNTLGPADPVKKYPPWMKTMTGMGPSLASRGEGAYTLRVRQSSEPRTEGRPWVPICNRKVLLR